jgi:hypothetical protein
VHFCQSYMLQVALFLQKSVSMLEILLPCNDK